MSNSWEGVRAFLRKLYFYRNSISGRSELVPSCVIIHWEPWLALCMSLSGVITMTVFMTDTRMDIFCSKVGLDVKFNCLVSLVCTTVLLQLTDVNRCVLSFNSIAKRAAAKLHTHKSVSPLPVTGSGRFKTGVSLNQKIPKAHSSMHLTKNRLFNQCMQRNEPEMGFQAKTGMQTH